MDRTDIADEARARRSFQRPDGTVWTPLPDVPEEQLDTIPERYGYREVVVIGLDELPDVEESDEFDGEYRVGDLDDFPNEVAAANAQEARVKAREFLAVARFIEQRDATTEVTR